MSGDSDAKALELLQLLGRHERQLRAYVLSLVPHWDDAEEILQLTRVRLWEQFDQYAPTRNFGAWARTIARYQILAMWERLSRHPQLRSDAFLEAVAQRFDADEGLAEDRAKALRGCLEKLEDPRRDVLMRYYSGQESMAQLAEATSRTLDAVEHIIRRARLTLARCIERTLSGER